MAAGDLFFPLGMPCHDAAPASPTLYFVIYDKIEYHSKLSITVIGIILEVTHFENFCDKGMTFPPPAEENMQNTFAHGLTAEGAATPQQKGHKEICQTHLKSNLESPNPSQIYLAVVTA